MDYKFHAVAFVIDRFLHFVNFNVIKRCSKGYSEAVNRFGGTDFLAKHNLI